MLLLPSAVGQPEFAVFPSQFRTAVFCGYGKVKAIRHPPTVVAREMLSADFVYCTIIRFRRNPVPHIVSRDHRRDRIAEKQVPNPEQQNQNNRQTDGQPDTAFNPRIFHGISPSSHPARISRAKNTPI